MAYLSFRYILIGWKSMLKLKLVFKARAEEGFILERVKGQTCQYPGKETWADDLTMLLAKIL